MIELYTVVNVTPGSMTVRAIAGRSYSGKVHSFDNEPAAKRRRTLLANKWPSLDFAVLLTVVRDSGLVSSEWITPTYFPAPVVG